MYLVFLFVSVTVFAPKPQKATPAKLRERGIYWNNVRQPENLWKGCKNWPRKSAEIKKDSAVGPLFRVNHNLSLACVHLLGFNVQHVVGQD